MESKELIIILNIIKNKIDSPTTNLTWSRYNNIAELLQELDLFLERLMRDDVLVIKDLKLLFAPTGSLQEISIDSGWGEEFLEISSTFDKLF